MSPDDHLHDLLERWEQEQAEGRDLSAAELCRDYPELTGNVARALATLRDVDRLVTDVAGEAAATPPVASDTPNAAATMDWEGAPSPVVLAPPRGPDELGRLGGYRVLAILGQGGMGRVYRAEDPVLRRHVALKVMTASAAAQPGAKERFLREARAAAALQHDHVVPIYQVGEECGLPFLAMPLLAGETLEARLQRERRLSMAEVLRLGRETAEGLAAAHAKGLIHRDIKPLNLWLETPEGAALPRVKILDFGLARAAEGDGPRTRAGVIVGTPAYMSPEQVNGQAVDGRSDLFSLGCVLYRMAAGAAPFRGPSLTSVLLAVAEHHPPPPSALRAEVSLALSELVMRMLAKDPAQRPTSARAVVEALGAIERGLVSTSPAAPEKGHVRPSPSAKSSDRRWWRWIAAAGVLMAAAVVLAVSLPRYWSSDLTTAPEALTTKPAVTPMAPPKGSLDVLLYQPDNPRRQNLWLDDVGALPLRPGDEFCIEAELNRPAYLYVLWIDTDGQVLPVFPWRPGHWEKRPEVERPVARLRRPEALDQFYKVPKGTPGMETLVLLARETPLPRDLDLRAELGVLPRPAAQELLATAWFENGEPVRNRRGRTGMFDVTQRDDPVLQTQQRIKARLLERHFSYSLAVSFANRGQ
jgi:serine/threonine protein kinase